MSQNSGKNLIAANSHQMSKGASDQHSNNDNLMDDNVYNQMSKDNNNVDIDEIPIPVSKPKTFE